MTVEWWAWAAFAAFIVAMLLLDLLVLHRDAHAVTMKEAATWSAIWIALGLSFGAVVFAVAGGSAAAEYLTGYVIEKSLSVDNIFVFAMLFSYFAVPREYQHRVLFLGIVGALVLRAVFIAGGAALLEHVHWMVYVFGGFLVLTGWRMARHRDQHLDPSRNPVLRLVRRSVPMTDGYRGQRFVIRTDGRWIATPLLAVLVVVETTDVLFAVDSIPAIFAVTRDVFLVFTSNAFAILGLRALYFLLEGMMSRFANLKIGLSVVLVFVGIKMLASEFVEIPVPLSLGAILAILAVSIALPARPTKEGPGPAPAPPVDGGAQERTPEAVGS